MNVFWLLALYYLAVALFFYRQDFFGFLSQNRRPHLVPVQNEANKQEAASNQPATDHQPEFSVVHDLLEDLKAFWPTAGTLPRQELVLSLTHIIARYPPLRGSALKSAINSQILLEADQFCSVMLTEEELDSLWLSA